MLVRVCGQEYARMNPVGTIGTSSAALLGSALNGPEKESDSSSCKRTALPLSKKRAQAAKLHQLAGSESLVRQTCLCPWNHLGKHSPGSVEPHLVAITGNSQLLRGRTAFRCRGRSFSGRSLGKVVTRKQQSQAEGLEVWGGLGFGNYIGE